VHSTLSHASRYAERAAPWPRSAGHILRRVRGSDVDRHLAGVPELPVATPASVIALAAGRDVRAVWRNELGGVTFEMGVDSARCFVKWLPAGAGLDLEAEAARLRWAGQHCVVPEVIETGADDDGSWLATRAIPGTNAVADRWKRDPLTAVRAIGAGLRHLHDSLPVDDCPFSWSAEDRIASATTVIDDPPGIDKLVVCHGDACAPNTLIADDGSFTGHVDLGALGIADRWADLAIATWSTTWNYGPGWESALLDAYGVAPDGERTRYYRMLWDLT